MAKRFWGLSRRQTIVAFGLAVLVGVALALALPRGDGTRPNPRRSHALWAFGFATVRIDPRTLQPAPHALPPGFGSVLSTPGRAYLFEPADGRVGLLDASRSTLGVVGRVPPGGDEPAAVDPLIAKSSDSLWLVSRPGTLTRFDLADGRAGSSIDLGAAGRTGRPTTTRVVTSGDSVIAVSEVPAGYAVARINARARTQEAMRVVPGSGPVAGLAADGRSAWIVTGGAALRIDVRTLRVVDRIAIPAMSSQVPRGAVLTPGALWTLGDNASTLLRVDLSTRRADVALHVLPSEPASPRGPTSLVAADGRVWVMVQRSSDPQDHTVRVAGVTTAGKATKAADLPTELFVGAIAVT
jgi:hypothetical protein